MWLFDFLKTSYNFAKNIKLLLDRMGIDTTNNHIISWYDLLVIHNSIALIFQWHNNCPSDLNINILRDIKKYLTNLYIRDFDKIQAMDIKEQDQYLINIFNNQELTILEFTYFVMGYSAYLNWVSNHFNKDDEEIVRKYFNF